MGKYNCRARNKFEQQVEELKNTLFDLEERLKELPLSQMRFLNAKESAELGRAFVEGLEEGLKKGYQDYYSLNQGGKKMKEIKIKIKTLKNGQVEKYGDLNYEYELKTKGLSENEVKIYCTEILNRCNQTKEEWNRDDANSYFKGYYKLEKISGEGYGADEKGTYKYYVHFPSTH